MDVFSLLIFIRYLAVAVGVGASLSREFLIIESLQDGHIDHRENQMIKVVDGLLRAVFIGLFVATICLLLVYKLNGGFELFSGTAAFMELALIGILAVCAIAGEAEVLPYGFLSGIGTATWLSLFFFEEFGQAIQGSFVSALFFYVIVASLGIFVVEYLRRFMHFRKQ